MKRYEAKVVSPAKSKNPPGKLIPCKISVDSNGRVRVFVAPKHAGDWKAIIPLSQGEGY